MEVKKICFFDAVNITLAGFDYVLIKGKYESILTYGKGGLHICINGDYQKLKKKDLKDITFYKQVN